MSTEPRPYSEAEVAGYREAIPGALRLAKGRDAADIRKDARWLASVDALLRERDQLLEVLGAARQEAANAWKIVNGRADATLDTKSARLVEAAAHHFAISNLREHIRHLEAVNAEMLTHLRAYHMTYPLDPYADKVSDLLAKLGETNL